MFLLTNCALKTFTIISASGNRLCSGGILGGPGNDVGDQYQNGCAGKEFVRLNLPGVWVAEYCEWNTLCGVACYFIIRKYNWTISFSWSRFFAVSYRWNLGNASSKSSCSSFICFTFTSASLLSPTANCGRACSCERGTFRFLCGLVTIFSSKGSYQVALLAQGLRR